MARAITLSRLLMHDPLSTEGTGRSDFRDLWNNSVSLVQESRTCIFVRDPFLGTAQAAPVFRVFPTMFLRFRLLRFSYFIYFLGLNLHCAQRRIFTS